MKTVECDGRVICLARTADGTVHAIDDACTHEGTSLSEQGAIEGQEVECLMHGSTFDLRTGAVTGPPATTSTRAYPVVIEHDRVSIELD